LRNGQVDRVRTAALRRLGGALLLQSARHEAALAVLCRGGARGLACALERRAAVQARAARGPGVQGCVHGAALQRRLPCPPRMPGRGSARQLQGSPRHCRVR